MVLDHLEKGFSLLLKFLECLLADLRALIEVEDVLDQALRDVLEDEADDIVHGLVLEDGVEDFDRQVNLVFEVLVNLLQAVGCICIYSLYRIVEGNLPLCKFLFLTVKVVDFQHTLRINRFRQRGYRGT